MTLQYQDYGGDYVKRFDDSDPETFIWVLKTPNETTDSVEYQQWLVDGNVPLDPPIEPDPPPEVSTPVIVVDASFLADVQNAGSLADIKQAILNAAMRAQPTP